MEGPVAPMDCVSENEADQTCPLIPGCLTRPVWVRVRDSIIDAIDSITLADLLDNRSPALQELATSGSTQIHSV
jgi:DNA-binding IscR family transcriptional regulator